MSVLRLWQLWLKPFNWLKGQSNDWLNAESNLKEKVQLHLPLDGVLWEGNQRSVKPVGYEPNPNAALKPCRAATSLSVDKNTKVRWLPVLKKYNMGPMEKKNVLRRLMRCWIGFWRT